MDRIQKEKDVAAVASALAYIGIAASLYAVFSMAGVDPLKSLVESLVVSATIVTLVVLYLFGRIWKREG